MPAARPRRPAASRSRRASRRSRRRASRPSPPAGARRRARARGAGFAGSSARAPADGSGERATWRPVTRSAFRREPAPPRLVVPEVVGVGHDPDLVEAGLVEKRDGIGDRVHARGCVALRGVDRLETEPDAGLARRGGDPLQPVDDDRPRLRLRAAAERAGQAEHALGLVGGEAPDGRADRLDALLGVGRALHAGDRELGDRRHGRDAVRRRRDRARAAARGWPRRRRAA